MRLPPQRNGATNKAPPFPPQGIRSAGGTLSGQPEGGSGRNRPPNKAAGGYPPAGPAAQPSIEQPHVEIEAVTQAEEPGPSGPGGVRGAPPKRLTPLAVGSRAQPWSLFGYFLANQKVTPRRGGGQGIYIFSYALPEKGHRKPPTRPHDETEQKNNKQSTPTPPAGDQNPPEAPFQLRIA